LFLHFSRNSAPEGMHNILLDKLVERKKEGESVGLLTPMREHLDTWWDPGESYDYKSQLRNCLNICDANMRKRTFNTSNNPYDSTGDLGPVDCLPGNFKYHKQVADYMNEPSLELRNDDRDLTRIFSCTELCTLVESIGATSVHDDPRFSCTFGPNVVCARCKKHKGTLEHCTKLCTMLKENEAVDFEKILWGEPEAKEHMQRLTWAVKKQRLRFNTSLLQRGDVIVAFTKHDTNNMLANQHHKYKIIGRGCSPEVHDVYSNETGGRMFLNTKELADVGQLQLLMRGSCSGDIT
jgi:hypothetical protein